VINHPGFHAKAGWYFERQPDGSVKISAAVQRTTETLVVDAAEWASVVAAVSRDGGTSQTFAAAREIHDPEPTS
jgi:hypothetical protein